MKGAGVNKPINVAEPREENRNIVSRIWVITERSPHS